VNTTILTITILKEREKISSYFDEVRQQLRTSGSEGPDKERSKFGRRKELDCRTDRRGQTSNPSYTESSERKGVFVAICKAPMTHNLFTPNTLPHQGAEFGNMEASQTSCQDVGWWRLTLGKRLFHLAVKLQRVTGVLCCLLRVRTPAAHWQPWVQKRFLQNL